MHPEALAALTADLVEFRAEHEDPALREALVRHGLSRLVGTVELVPEHLRAGRILQLGAAPFVLTQCLRQVCSGPLTLASYHGTTERRGEQVLRNHRTGEQIRLTFDLFDVETEDFPYPDASFDVVVFSEIIEHLTTNPVRALSEMHRVLGPDGVLVVTTPNGLSLSRLEHLLQGSRDMVDRYSPGFGPAARHNREYYPEELRQLLESTGFVVEEMIVRDLHGPAPRRGVARALWKRALAKRVLTWYATHPRGEHMFVRARRAPRFRWTFVPTLFEGMDFYVLVRHPWLEMGVNDSIQCAFGWHPLESAADGDRRWIRDAGQALLRSPERAHAIHLEWYAAGVAGAAPLPVRVVARHRFRWQTDPSTVYADEVVQVERGRWCRTTLPLASAPDAGEEIEVNIAPDADAVRAPALASLPESQRGIAIRRIWFDATAPDQHP